MKKLLALFLLSSLLLCTSYNAKAGDTISLVGSSLKITGAVNPTYLSAVGLAVSYTAPNIILKGTFGTLNVSYARISQPSHTSPRQLLFKIDSMASLARGGIAGTASSTNQLTQITDLHKLAGSDSGFVYRFDSTFFHSTSVLAFPGKVSSIVVSVAGAAGTIITVYDNTTKVCEIPGNVVGIYAVNARCSTSIKIASEGGTTAPKFTTFYRRLGNP
jgi:hypothetical protein